MSGGRQPAQDALAAMDAGDWDGAHAIVQAHEGDRDCDWVHAHLHRREGDVANARFWYRRAGRPAGAGGIAEEMAALRAALSAQT